MEKQVEKQIPRMKELVTVLSEAGKAYYQESREIMSNFEYDKLYDELVSLEKETGIVFANSPFSSIYPSGTGTRFRPQPPPRYRGSGAFSI